MGYNDKVQHCKELHGGSDLATVINKAIVSKTADFLESAITLL
jgi:hypothetical protein